MFAILSKTLPSLSRAPILPSLNYNSKSFTSLLFSGFKNTWIKLSPPTAITSPFAWTNTGDATCMILRTKCCLRTNKSAAKRFKVMGNGRIKRKKAGKRHNTGHKGRSRVNRLAQGAPIKEKSIENRMRVLIGG